MIALMPRVAGSLLQVATAAPQQPAAAAPATAIGQPNAIAIALFIIFIAVTLGITYWASKRTSTATEFWAAGRGISGGQNGFAIAGERHPVLSGAD